MFPLEIRCERLSAFDRAKPQTADLLARRIARGSGFPEFGWVGTEVFLHLLIACGACRRESLIDETQDGELP
jgi:hypothetical protein